MRVPRRGVLLAVTAVSAAVLVAPLEAPAAAGGARAKGGPKVVTFSKSKVPLRRLAGARRTLARALRMSCGTRVSTTWLGMYSVDTSGIVERAAFLDRVEHTMAHLDAVRVPRGSR